MRIIEGIRPSSTRRNPTRRFRPTPAGMKRILALGEQGPSGHGIFIQRAISFSLARSSNVSACPSTSDGGVQVGDLE